MRVKTPSPASLVSGLWLAYLCGALYWLCGLGVTGWRFWAVVLPVATLRPLCAALGSALGHRREADTARTARVAGADVLAGRTSVEVFAWPPLEGRLLPASYDRAGWRGTLPVDSRDRLGLSFNLEGGDVLRLSLDLRSARHVAESIAEYLRGHERRGSPPRPRPDQPPPAGPSPSLRDRG